MSKSDAWMPLYVGDYMADTMHLTGPEHGAYLLLLMHSWRTGALPDDDRKLAAIARTAPAEWRRMAETIRAFFQTDAGRLVSPRLERERQRATSNVEQRRAAGVASAAARARRREGNARSTAVDAEDGSQEPEPAGTQEHSPSKSEPGNGAENRAKAQKNNESRSTGVGDPLQQNGRPSPSPREEEQKASPSAPAEPSPPPDARTALWTEGLARLRRLTGASDRSARAMLGRLCRDARDDCALVSCLLFEAERDRPGDPSAWLVAAIRSRTAGWLNEPKSKMGWMLDS